MIHKNGKILNPYRIRSFLVVPSIREELFGKIIKLCGEEKPDVIIFDLEDSVHPDFKSKARSILKQYLLEDRKYREEFSGRYFGAVRVNPYGSAHVADDMEIFNELGLEFLGLTKIESPKEVRFFRENSTARQFILPIETIEGFRNRESIMRNMEWYDVLLLGYEDLSSELMIDRPENLNSPNPVINMILETIISAKEMGITMIDAVSRKYGTPENLKALHDECLYTAGLGLSGKVAIHPSQVHVINSVFDKKRLLEKAEAILGKFEKLNDGSFVVAEDNKEMMDRPSYKFFSKVIELWNRG
jgi:citrate lyase beta subunit